MSGLLLDTAVLATTFLPGVDVVVLSPVGGGTGGGGMSAAGATVAFFPLLGSGGLDAGEELANALPCLCFTDNGSGGGGISEAVIDAVLVDTASPSWMASSPEAGGEANRAVGRGPDEDGPLDFLRIGCGGGGLEEEGVRPFFPIDEAEPCSGVSRRGGVGSLTWPSVP